MERHKHVGWRRIEFSLVIIIITLEGYRIICT